MYCRKCGKEIPDSSKFCPECGYPVDQGVVEAPDNSENYTIRLSRPGVNGPARVYKILIDGFDAGKLGARSTIDIPSVEGTHTVAFCWAGKTERIINVTLSAANPLAEISAALDMMGHLNLSLMSGISSASPQQEKSHRVAKKSMGCLSAVGIAFAAILLIVIIASARGSKSSENAQKSTNIPVATDFSSETPVPFPAQTQTLDNWTITVNGFEFMDKIPSSWVTSFQTEDNSKFCIVNLSVTNSGTEQDTFVPILNVSDILIDCKIEAGPYTYNNSALLGYREDLTNKVLNPLETANGILAFSFPNTVADDDSQLHLVFSKNGTIVAFKLR